jgi:hypothetical protein
MGSKAVIRAILRKISNIGEIFLKIEIAQKNQSKSFPWI